MYKPFEFVANFTHTIRRRTRLIPAVKGQPHEYKCFFVYFLIIKAGLQEDCNCLLRRIQAINHPVELLLLHHGCIAAA